MIQAADIDRMDVQERLQAMELLWASLSRTPEVVPSPDWHGAVLADRLAKIKRGEAQLLTLAEVKARLQKPAA
ncbi:MAG: addiction module protein [Verrucomicrobia bacterium]|nr:addiction module protein [Verrucomicrobiota bacterium]